MKKGFTLIELMIVVAIIAIIAAIAIPGLLAAQRASNERNASASLKTFTTAEADFRANDRDGNRVLDYWTGDCYGLYGLTPVRGTTTTLPGTTSSAAEAIKLIEPSLAGADGSHIGPDPDTVYSYVEVASTIVTFAPKAGYFYRSFSFTETSPGSTADIQTETDGVDLYGDTVHDFGRFAFGAFPIARGTGTFIYVVNEDATIWRLALAGAYVATFTGGTTSNATVGATGVGGTATWVDDATELVYFQSPPANGFARLD